MVEMGHLEVGNNQTEQQNNSNKYPPQCGGYSPGSSPTNSLFSILPWWPLPCRRGMILARIRQSSHFSLHTFLFPSHSQQQTDPIRIGYQNLQNRKNLLLVKNNLENNTRCALMSVTSFLPLVVWSTFFSSLQATYQILNNSFLKKL